MALALRLTTLSYVVVHANARRFQRGLDAGDWAPVTPTTEPATSGPDERISKTTSAPDRWPLDGELRRRDDSTSTICGYSVDDLDGPAVTCDNGGFCRLDRVLGIVGCCTETNPRGCIVPTTCLESSRSAQWSGDPLTTYCSDSDRPHCVTHSYVANFYDPLYGAYFIGCAARAASRGIVASLVPGSDTSFTKSIIATTTVTVNISSNDGSSTAVPSGSGGSSGSGHVGAIVGGVVGGVAGLSLIVGAIFFFLHRRKKRSQALNPLALGQKMPPSDHDMYHNEPIPGSQYPSTFYGEAPPGMVQISEQPIITYPPTTYGVQNTVYNVESDHSAEVPAYFAPRAVPPKPQDEAVSPLEESPVSPVSPAENYNTMVSALSNQSPPLQPLQPATRHHHQSEYAQYSPPPPEQYHSYHPYPGT
ncbi:hypothetical protein E0Z10_g9184 [Xylaria hypoxylon]|uniref:Mid2 domain-containing protein n=1 Tax=Xylaria hypoxylon TaxID=37992 RepID=A0A4Z0YK13_9PEZI|nr:hypothetical protein E0Z10_g9184 [Xylaria hypoxylon]